MTLRAGLAIIALTLSPILAAQSERGSFEVVEASHQLIDGVYFIDARIELNLPAETVNALRSRLPLTIRIEFEFLNRLRLWWDNTAQLKTLRFQLSYHPLTDRYVVWNLNTNDREDFVTLAAALEFIGRLDDVEIVAAAELDQDRRYDVRVRAVLDKDDLPGPLRLLAFWRRDWSLASDWLQWRLDDD